MKSPIKVLSFVFFCYAGFSASSASSLDLLGKSIKVELTTVTRLCRHSEGSCKDIDTPAKSIIYFGKKGTVFAYNDAETGVLYELGKWMDDGKGHKVRWSIVGNSALWEAASEKTQNTIVYSVKGNKCKVRHFWDSIDSKISIVGAGVKVKYCNVIDGNAGIK